MNIDLAQEALAADVSNLTSEQQALLMVWLNNQRRGAGDEKAQRSIGPAVRNGRLPLSYAQRRLWFLEQLNPGTATYNISTPLRLSGSLNLGALEAAFSEVLRRHEVLRTSFQKIEDEPWQVIDAVAELRIFVVDLQSLRSEAEAGARGLAAEDAARGFCLERSPLVRVSLLQISQESQILLATMHHIVSDGWSMNILLQEVAELYSAFRQGQPSPLEELAVQYGDYAVWQRNWATGEALNRDLEYWRKQMSGRLGVLEIPTDRRRGATARLEGKTLQFVMSPETTEKLRRVSRENDATLFMTLLSVFGILLSRYSGQTDMVIGAPFAGRTHADVESLIGFFVNILPLRVDLSGNPTFEQLIQRVRQCTLEAHAHQDLPFDKLVEVLQPERSLTHTPLFQVVLAVHNNPAARKTGPSALAAQPVQLENTVAKYEMTLTFEEEEDYLAGKLEYDSELYEPETMRRWLRHWNQLLSGIVEDPRQKIFETPLMSAGEQTALAEQTRSRTHYSCEYCLHELFDAQCQRTPEAVAVVSEGKQITYQELNRRATRLAECLRHYPVGSEVLIATLLEPGLEMVIAILAILKAGSAYVPLDPRYPEERLSFVLQDSQAAVVITSSRHLPLLPKIQHHIVLVDNPAEQTSQNQTRDKFRARPDPENLAYVIYTSGSTGRPKGVAVTHANVTRLFDAARASFWFGEDDSWSLFHSFAFDFSVWEFWGALLFGGRLVVVPYEISRSPDLFLSLLAEENVSILSQTPSAFKQLMWAVDRALAASRDAESKSNGRKIPERRPISLLASLRAVIFGGEALEMQTLHRWKDWFGLDRPVLINMYGITETTVHVTFCQISDLHLVSEAVGSPVGFPLDDLSVYLLDRGMQLAAPGIAAEIHVGGDGVARGYLNQSDLTAERFVPDPFSTVAGARLYCSGDRARQGADAKLMYLGRIDEQVKIRGFRIELGEIETILSQHKSVQASVVVVQEGPAEEKRLVAYVIPADAKINVGVVRAYLTERLPDYMVPSAIVPVESLPLTENGKLDRQRLKDLKRVPEAPSDAYSEPRTTMERMLANIWKDVLGVERVGLEDGFFGLGGDSISSIRVRALAEKNGYQILLSDLFKYQTLCELAAALETSQPIPAIAQDYKPFDLIDPHDRLQLPEYVEDAYPLTSLQMGMIFHTDLQARDGVYHNVSTYRIRARLDIERLRRAAERIVSLHPVLRTSFDLSSYQEPLQLVHKKINVPFEVHSLVTLSQSEQDRRLAEWTTMERQRYFDWTRPPLLRFSLHVLSDELFQFTLTEHHAVLDGWSVATLLRELFQEYEAAGNAEIAPSLLSPRSRFRDYVVAERAALTSALSKDYWDKQMGLDPGTRFRTWGSDIGSGETNEPGNREARISSRASEDLKHLARRLAVPIKSVLLAAHLKACSIFTGQSRVVTGLVSNGRMEEVDGDRVLGLFLNTVPFYSRIEGGSWTSLIQRVHAEEVKMLPHRRYPMAELQKRRPGEPLFDVAFNFTHFHALDALSDCSSLDVLDGTAYALTNFALVAFFDVNLKTEDITLTLGYDGVKVSSQQASKIAVYYERILNSMACDPEANHDRDALLSVEEEQLILVDWNATYQDYLPGQTLNGLFEAQAARAPDSIAIGFGDQQLSYAEVNRRASRLAGYLQGSGVGPEVLVGVLMERSLEMVLSLVAIEKAGGAYVPLDPEYPSERLKFLTGDANPAVTLAQSKFVTEELRREGRIICVDLQWAEIARCNGRKAKNDAGPENLAYMIYTSGSTGQPKGAMNTHRGIVNRLQWMQSAYGLGPNDVVLQKTPFSFDVSVWEFFLPLLAGARLVVAAPGGHRDPAYLAATIAEQGVTTIHFVPSMLQVFELAVETNQCASLRQVMCSGEALSYELKERYYTGFGGKLHNLYGPTETAVDVTAWECEPGGVAGRVPIGRPISNLQMYVLNEGMQPVPVGVSGELYIGGEGVGRGYHRRTGLTAEKFVPDSLSRRTGARLYRTGDVARYGGDGNLEYLGRNDHQVKLRGMRVELGEIEAALASHECVREAAVVLRGQPGAEERCLAYVVANGDANFDVTDLHRYLKERLPSYMVPAAVIRLQSLPLLNNGKLDRNALPEPDAASTGSGHASVSPTTLLEAQLVAIWEEVLGSSPIGVTDDFFEIGGHSLAAVRLLARIEKQLHRKLTHSVLWEKRTVQGLATLLEECLPEKNHSPLVAMQPLGNGRPFFCVHGGSVLGFGELVHHLGSNRRFYGLQDPTLDGAGLPYDELTTMARDYIEAMRSIQEQGPYLLGGYSFGGFVAFEMAQQLQAQHQPVSALIMLDTPPPDANQRLIETYTRLGMTEIQMLIIDVKIHARQVGKEFTIDFEECAQLDESEQFAYVLEKTKEARILSTDIGLPLLHRYQQMHRGRRIAMRRYKTAKYCGPITLFRPEATYSSDLHDLEQLVGPKIAQQISAAEKSIFQDRTYGWGQITENRIEIVTVPGDHYTMLLAPQAQGVAAQLAQLLERAESEYGTRATVQN